MGKMASCIPPLFYSPLVVTGCLDSGVLGEPYVISPRAILFVLNTQHRTRKFCLNNRFFGHSNN
jgi:hypothetical protein